MFPTATHRKLPNGLNLVLVPDDHVESVCFGLFVASGSRHEKPEDAGISHFIEHMLFKGTAKRSTLDISRAIEGRGGNFNAYTSEEGTCFYAYMPCEWIGVAVDIIADMYRNAAIPESEFARERNVILEEIKMYDDEPDSVASENLSRALFPKNALGRPIAGSAKSLMPMTPGRLRDYMAKAYVPSATTAVVAGRFDSAKAEELVTAAFGDMKGGKPPVAVKFNNRTKTIPEIRAERDIHQVQLAMGFRTFGVRVPMHKKCAASVFDAMMGRSMSSRLFQSVREKRGLSYDIRSHIQYFEETGGWAITAGLDTSRTDEALAAINRELDRIRTVKPSAAELKRTKEFIAGNFRLGLESIRARLFYYGNCVQTYGCIQEPDDVVAYMNAVTAEDVRAVAEEILDESNRSISWVVPKKANA